MRNANEMTREENAARRMVIVTVVEKLRTVIQKGNPAYERMAQNILTTENDAADALIREALSD